MPNKPFVPKKLIQIAKKKKKKMTKWRLSTTEFYFTKLALALFAGML